MQPLHDPVETLTGPQTGELGRVNARRAFVDAYCQFTAVARGFTGITSAAIELHAHQVGVARRVLADPVQRYLLADEVGLGKTIEAGFIIRQRLIDAPRSKILVLVPTTLMWQWEDELASKFRLHELGSGAGINVHSYEDERAFRQPVVPDLLIIDEAHRVAVGAHSDSKALRTRYEAVRHLAHRVPRILLLSATPVLHRERDFLAMLHLLDPDTYALDNLGWFKDRLAARERVAEAMLALSSKRKAFLLKDSLPGLRETFGGDARMLTHLSDLEQALDDSDEVRERVLGDARVHISESYRLHHRLLRNRREVIALDAYKVRGRGPLTVLRDPDPGRDVVDRWIEEWRATLLNDALGDATPGAVEAALAAFRVYATYATGDPTALAQVLLYRLTRRNRWRDSASLNPEACAGLKAFSVSEAQHSAIRELLEALGYDAETETFMTAGFSARIAERLAMLPDAVYVVFASAHSTADTVAEHLERHGRTVYRCTTAMDPEHRHLEVTRFREASATRFLVCDAIGEEGLNLQVTDAVVHLDLPWSVSRIEQRIGRADRFGAGAAVRNIVISADPADSVSEWWLRALRDAFHVFARTTTSTQYAIEAVEHDLFASLLENGLGQANLDVADVGKQVTEEQERIDRIDSLDALARQDSDDLNFVAEVSEADRTLADAFARVTLDAVDANAQALRASTAPHGAGIWNLTVEGNSAAVQLFRAVTGATHEITADRATAVAERAVSLLRPGAPLVEVLRLQQNADPTTQSCALWRASDDEQPDAIAVRCDFLIEADPAPAFAVWSKLEAARPRDVTAHRTDADAPLALAALKRRLDGYLPPLPISVWINEAGQPIRGDQEAEYEGALSVAEPLGELSTSQRLALSRRFGAPSIEDLLAQIAHGAREAALASHLVRDTVETASVRARREFEDIDRVLRLRLDHDDSDAAKRDLATEQLVAQHLLAALSEPVLRSSGACLLATTRDRPGSW